MRFVIGIIIGFLLGAILVAKATTDISVEPLLNRVYNSVTDTIAVEGI